MAARTPQQFRLERWFAEFEFVAGINNLAGSGAESPTTAELLALDGLDAQARYLATGLDCVESAGTPALRTAIAALHPGLSPEHILVTTGASEAILLLQWALLVPGDNMVVEDPCYQSHAKIATALGAEARRLPLREEHGWRPDPHALRGLLDTRTRLVFINHPHNPTGSTLDEAQLAELAGVAEEAGAILVSDEVFRPIALDGQATPSVTALSGQAAALGDLSKPWGLGGLRVGWVACRDTRLLARLGEVRDYTTMCTSGPAEHLAAIALRHSEALLTPRLANARANLADLAALVGRAEGLLRWQRPGGGYSAWLRLPDGEKAAPFCRRLAERRSLLLLPGSVFGEDYAGYLQIGFGGGRSRFLAGLATLEPELATLCATEG